MSAIFKRSFHNSSRVLTRGPLGYQGFFPRDWKPGPYPTTDDERRAAAIKYGLRPEDYKPIDPDDYSWHAGDYPDLHGPTPKYPIVNWEVRDPYENYSSRVFRRNFGEPTIKEITQFNPERRTYTGIEDHMEFNLKNVSAHILVVGIIVLCAWWLSQPGPNRFRWKSPIMPKQYPYDLYRAFPWDDPRKYPITNYTFESETSDTHGHGHH